MKKSSLFSVINRFVVYIPQAKAWGFDEIPDKESNTNFVNQF